MVCHDHDAGAIILFSLDDDYFEWNVMLIRVSRYVVYCSVFIYSNEQGVGRGLKKSGIPRSEVFVVTKLWFDDHGYDRCKAAFAESLKKYVVLWCFRDVLFFP